MKTRVDYEDIELRILAPYAVRSRESRGRQHAEKEHDYRTAFQRDRDRIVHSRAFRRLEYKTQVFVNHEGDHYRTRLTHTLEVSQIARTIARSLALNEDLAEAIALAHDLGHTPFGHSGQDVMARLMRDHGGFEHNRQSFRIVTFLENPLPQWPGMNLSYEVLEGIAKHATDYDLPDKTVFLRAGYPSLEAQVCNFADEIAYNNHDIDDGIRSGLIGVGDLAEVELWQRHFGAVMAEHPLLALEKQCRLAVKRILNFLATDLITHTLSRIAAQGLKTAADVREHGKGTVDFSPEVKVLSAGLKKFLYARLYRHYRVERMAAKAERVITDLFQAYERNPKILPSDFVRHYGSEPIQLIVCDYIAGMTDRFALEEYGKLFDPFKKV